MAKAKEDVKITETLKEATADNTVVVDNKEVGKVEVKEATEKEIVEEVVKSLTDEDEIELESLIPNVSYKDVKNNDFYEWDKVGHTETMRYRDLKDMNRNHKTYFKDLWLKPLDERVIKSFGLASSYKNYNDLINPVFYSRDNLTEIKEKIDTLPPKGIKFTIITKVKSMIELGKITDVKVVRELERMFNIDLIDFLDL